MKAGFVYVVIFALLLNVNTIAQSGRSKTPPPPPKPTTEQPPPATTKILNLPEGGKVVKYDTDGISSRFTLKNGLTVIIRERHSTPLAAICTYIKAGYLNDPDEAVGLVHLMEHIFYKGTTTRPGETIAAETARLGGLINVRLSYDQTSYYATAPAESLPKILEIQSDMLQNPAFDAEELKQAVLEVTQESRRKQDNATALALEKMYATAFTTHRMKRWSLGSDEVMKAVTREQLQAFYQTFYRPENTVLVVVGDVNTNQVIPQIQQLYANFGATPKPELKPTEPKPSEPKPEAQKPQAKPQVTTATAPTPPAQPEVKANAANPQSPIPNPQSLISKPPCPKSRCKLRCVTAANAVTSGKRS